MALSATDQSNLMRLVVSMFNAAPGAVYFNDIAAVFEANGHNLALTAKALSGTGAFHSLYSDGLTSAQFATAFLTTLGLQGNQDAIDFIVAKSNAGENRGQIILEAEQALLASTNSAFADAKNLLLNKVEVATFFTITLNNGETDFADLQAVLNGVTSDHATVVAAEFNLQNPPQDLNLTIGADHLTGGAGNDVFTAGVALSTVDLILRPTLGGDDSLDGGAGHDVLNAVVNGQFGLAAGDDPHIAAIEEINFQVRASGSILSPNDAFAYVDFGNVSGVDVVNMHDSNEDAILNIFNVQEAVDIGMHNLEGGYMEVDFDDDALGSDSASQNVTIENIDDGELEITTDGDDVITDLNLLVVGGGSNTLELEVGSGGSLGNYSLQNLTITGGGDLELTSYDDFSQLVSLNSTGLAGDLTIDISGDGSGDGNTNVESVLTGGGDDFVVVDQDLFDGDLDVTIDLGGGDNTLSMGHDGFLYDTDLNALDFSAATISNVQTLELNAEIDLYADTALDVSTIGGLQTVSVTESFFGNGYAFDLTGPETLTLAVAGEIDSLELGTTGILDLTITTNDGDLDLDSLTSDDITTLTLVANDATKGESASAFVDLDGSDDNLVTLSTVNVTADGFVSLEMAGDPGTPPTGGVAEVGTLTFSGYNKVNEPGSGNTFAGSVTIGNVPGGPLVVDVSGANNANQAAHAVALALDAVDGITATDNGSGVVSYSYDDPGTHTDMTASFNDTLNDGDALTVTPSVTTQGTAPTTGGTDATGFEGLTSVVVDAGANAHVDIEDALGAFTATVTAADDADVTLIDTGVTSVEVTATNVDLDIEQADGLGSVTATADDVATVLVQDAENLTTVTVVAGDDEGNNQLDLINTDSVSTIDLQGITDNDDAALSGNAFIDADVTLADFAGPVQVLIGTEDLNFHMSGTDGVREIFTFTGSDTGAVVIDNGLGGDGFLASVGGTGDRIDFSQMAGIDSLDDLAIVFNEGGSGNTHITSLVDGVNVDITVVGADVSLDAFHFIF